VSTKILFMHQNGILGGAEAHLLSVAGSYRDTSRVVLLGTGPLQDALERVGVDVRLLESSWASEGVRLGVPRPNARGVAAVLRLGWQTARLARGADLIYANSPKALTVAGVAGALARRPVLWHLHDLLGPEHFSPQAIRQAVRHANLIATRVLVNSQASANAFLRGGGHPGRLHVVDNGFDVPGFAPAGADDRESVRRELGLGASPVLGVVGRVVGWKGQHVVLDALSRLPGVVALVVGDEGEDPTYAAELRRRARELGVADRVRFLGFRADVPRLMRSVELVVHAAVAPEPFGRVIVEGMLAGRPVVAARAGGVLEIIEDGVSGVLVPPGDAGALAVAIAALLADPERASRIADTGRRRASERFGADRVLREIARHVEAVRRPAR
jgi:glycosyltransferase involved in cell wall biosynthesis